jgi:hypothetical protein
MQTYKQKEVLICNVQYGYADVQIGSSTCMLTYIMIKSQICRHADRKKEESCRQSETDRVTHVQMYRLKEVQVCRHADEERYKYADKKINRSMYMQTCRYSRST